MLNWFFGLFCDWLLLRLFSCWLCVGLCVYVFSGFGFRYCYVLHFGFDLLLIVLFFVVGQSFT